MDLGKDATFTYLVGMRSRYYAGTCTKEERAHIAKIGNIFFISEKVSQTSEEKQFDIEFKANYEKAVEARRIARLNP